MRLVVTGLGTHGKGEVSRYLASRTNLRYTKSTSEFIAVVFFETMGVSLGYKTLAECWADRRNHRETWRDFILEYNGPTGLRMYQEMVATNDILDGIRDATEFRAIMSSGLADLSIWVDARTRLPDVSDATCSVLPSMCDVIIDNNLSWEHTTTLLDDFIEKHLTADDNLYSPVFSKIV